MFVHTCIIIGLDVADDRTEILKKMITIFDNDHFKVDKLTIERFFSKQHSETIIVISKVDGTDFTLKELVFLWLISEIWEDNFSHFNRLNTKMTKHEIDFQLKVATGKLNWLGKIFYKEQSPEESAYNINYFNIFKEVTEYISKEISSRWIVEDFLWYGNKF